VGSYLYETALAIAKFIARVLMINNSSIAWGLDDDEYERGMRRQPESRLRLGHGLIYHQSSNEKVRSCKSNPRKTLLFSPCLLYPRESGTGHG
jgi:hypothetical protein